jgi:trehalose 6-phosphate synthase
VQDYHFALLPRMVRRASAARHHHYVFWHIPGPIPRRSHPALAREILAGLLGSSILGFTRKFHCNNFFDTVDRFLEARVDRETFLISHGAARPTEVRRYPISIEWPPAALQVQPPVANAARDVRDRIGVALRRSSWASASTGSTTPRASSSASWRSSACFELEPRWIGQFLFLQVAAPSRSSIDEYQNLDARVRALASEINERFGRPGYTPIVLKIEHHDAAQVYELYRAATCATSRACTTA